VLSVVGVGGDLQAARDVAYQAVSQVRLAGAQHRTDIAAAAAAEAAAAASAAAATSR
jgi:phosphoribosylamine--glycine ligase